MDFFDQPEELFGSTRPAHIPPIDLDEVGRKGGMSVDQHLNRKARAKPTNHNVRARKYWETRGYIYCPCEYRDVGYGGAGMGATVGKKHDLFGIFDALAMPRPNGGSPQVGLIGIQVCSSINRGERIRKMCSAEIDTKCGTARVDSLRAWLASGNKAVVLEFEKRAKVGNQEWFPVLHEVTAETITDVEKRRRK